MFYCWSHVLGLIKFQLTGEMPKFIKEDFQFCKHLGLRLEGHSPSGSAYVQYASLPQVPQVCNKS